MFEMLYGKVFRAVEWKLVAESKTLLGVNLN